MNKIFKLKRMIYESEEKLAQKRKEVHMDQESKSDNTGNSDPVTPHPEPDTSSHSIK